MPNQDNMITIALGRQYGSGGRMIARLLAKDLGIPFYDKELIAMAATKSGLNSQLLTLVDEHAMHIYMQASSAVAAASRGEDSEKLLSLNDQLFHAQSEIIRSVAEQGSCVIVGRTADQLLRNMKSLITIFVYADPSFRIKTIMELHDVPSEEAERIMEATDRERANYYRRLTGKHWATMENFDICINSSVLGVEQTAKQLASFARALVQKRSET